MTFSRDFDNLASIARERQTEILRIGAGPAGRRPGTLWSLGVLFVVVCAPLAALFLLRVW